MGCFVDDDGAELFFAEQAEGGADAGGEDQAGALDALAGGLLGGEVGGEGVAQHGGSGVGAHGFCYFADLGGHR